VRTCVFFDLAAALCGGAAALSSVPSALADHDSLRLQRFSQLFAQLSVFDRPAEVGCGNSCDADQQR
jgi:hypothetical protein